MRTTFIFIAFAMCSVLLFNACKEESAGDALSLSQNSIEASVEGGKYEIDIKTDAAWTAKFSEDIDWATVTPESGTGTGYVTVIIKPNISESPRYARLEIVSNGITKRVDVDQDTGSGIAAITSSKTIEVAATGATYEFSLIGRGDWQTSATENWIKFEKKQGTGNKSYIIYTGTSVKGVSDSTLTIYANPNLTDAPRSAFIILQSNLTYDTITVTQPKIDFDYYKDGELLTLHTNPDNPNHGAPVVIVGDGWGVEDLKKGGLWEKWVKGVKDILLQIEMAKDFPDLIDVYAVAAISNYRGVYGNNRFGTVAGVAGNLGAMASFGRQAMNKISHPNKQYTTYICSSNGQIGGFNQGELCALSTPDGEPSYVYWMLHEYFGHTFANLVDLYFNCSFSLDWPNPNNLTDSRNTPAGSPNWNWRTIDGKTFPACYRGGNCDTDGLYKAMKEDWNKGYGWMCDFTNDPAKVIW
ncbi:MAG: BACON domain-containing protein, partial [Dysgonamonadaceae bacterium]|nr:BACON domain-containing protein [Dysgonamonadaceae bacterium]